MKVSINFKGEAESYLKVISKNYDISTQEVIMEALAVYTIMLDEAEVGNLTWITNKDGELLGQIETDTLSRAAIK